MKKRQGTQDMQEFASAVLALDDRSLLSREIYGMNQRIPGNPLAFTRASVLRPFREYFWGKRILELNCGAGVLTRFMAESGGDVVAHSASGTLEPLLQAFTHGLDNVRFVSCCLKDLDLPRHGFDLIVAVNNVLESAPAIYPARSIHNCLRHLRRFLKPGGILMAGAANRLSFSTLAGLPNALGQRPMRDMDSCGTHRAAAVHLAELHDALSCANFRFQHLHLPFPALDKAVVMAHPSMLQEEGQAEYWYGLLLKSVCHFPPSIPTFSLEMGLRNIIRSGSLAALAPAWLVLGSDAEEALAAFAPSLLASYYNMGHAPEFSKEIRFVRSGVGIEVIRNRLNTDLPKGDCEQYLEREDFRQGESYFERLVEAVNTPGWSAASVAQALSPMFDWLRSQAVQTNGALLLPDRFLDATPANVIASNEGAVAIDLEWRDGKTCSLDYVLYRGLCTAFSSLHSVSVPDKATPDSVSDLAARVMQVWGIVLSDGEVDAFWMRSTEMLRTVCGIDFSLEHVRSSRLRIRSTPDHSEQK